MEKRFLHNKFFVADFTREEEWLSKQAEEGWHLVDTDGSTYEFEQGQKGPWVYRTDDFKKDDDPNTYLDKYTARGWKFVCRTKHRVYMKQKKVGRSLDTSVFTPDEDRFKFAKSLITADTIRMIPVYALAIALFVGGLYLDTQEIMSGVPMAIVHTIMFIIISFACIGVGVHMNEFRRYKRILKLRKEGQKKTEMTLEEAVAMMEAEEKTEE